MIKRERRHLLIFLSLAGFGGLMAFQNCSPGGMATVSSRKIESSRGLTGPVQNDSGTGESSVAPDPVPENQNPDCVAGSTLSGDRCLDGLIIMPLGDSITWGFNTADQQGLEGGYRYPLYEKLMQSLGPKIHMVGSQSNGPVGWNEAGNEGHRGWRIDQITSGIQNQGWLETYRPNVVILMIGTNDIGQNYDLANAPARLNALLDQIYNRLPNVSVVLSTVAPLGSPADQAVAQLNASVRSIYSMRAAQGYAISFADVHGGLTLTDLSDGCHPTQNGYEKVAEVLKIAVFNAVHLRPDLTQ